jgi:TIR domain
MRAIFISYRRDDAEGEAGRLFDDLVARFGEASVFMDVAAIQKGRDFRKAIDESIATCGVLLAVIGTKWVDAKNENGDRRLEDPFDFVRLEGGRDSGARIDRSLHRASWRPPAWDDSNHQ